MHNYSFTELDYVDMIGRWNRDRPCNRWNKYLWSEASQQEMFSNLCRCWYYEL